MIQFTSFCGVT